MSYIFFSMRLIITLLCFALVPTAWAAPLWMRYPAISPNGEKIVFSYQDDLWLVDSKGGKAEALTRHEAHDYMPVWSHDGKKIAFASFRYGNYDVFLMDLETRSITRLTYNSANDLPSDFSRDNSHVLFSSVRMDHYENAQFPYGRLGELYSISTDGKNLRQVTTISAEWAKYTADGKKIIFHNKKGYEDEWRKHHTSSVTRDVMSYDLASKKFSFLTDFKGEDRNPIESTDGKGFYYLSEESGSFNIWYKQYDGLGKRQVSKLDKHPIRFLSADDKGTLCYGYNGELYTLNTVAQPRKVAVSLDIDAKENHDKFKEMTSGCTEMAVSPNGKEIAFVLHGDVFVTAVDYGTTKTITATPWQERSVSFSPDGRAILYAAEKGSSWSVYQTKISIDEEKYFYNSTLLKETVVIETEQECFQPSFSPNGEEVAFLEERTTLRVVNLKTKKARTILAGSYNYSYSDGDQWYQWSPDGKWFLVDFNDPNRWMGELGLIASDSKGELVNLTQSGYGDGGGQWMAGGNMAMYFSDRYGMRSHGSWGAESDILGIFLNQKAYDDFKTPLSELDEEEPKKEETTDKEKEGKKADKKEDDKETVEEIDIELDGLDDRKVRLSLHSARLSGAVVDAKCRKLYYLARYEKGTDLWVYDLKERSAIIITKFEAGAGALTLSKDEKKAFVLSGGSMFSVTLENSQKKPISFKAQMTTDYSAERAYLFEHMWRQVQKKFYKVDLHGVDWDFYKKEYSRFLPHINNNHDYAEMASELLGELNASHTGCRFRSNWKHGDRTAYLGVFIDHSYTGKGIRIDEAIVKSPLNRDGIRWEKGYTLTAINGTEINSIPHYYELMNHKAGEKIRVAYKDKKGNEQSQTVTPLSFGAQYNLLYERWIEARAALVDELSKGRIGYVHVRGMDDASFRHVYEELLGKNSAKEAIIVDTRFNGGGWLHDDLATLLSGTKYVDFVPRGQYIGSDPHEKWNRLSCVLTGEGNYSDAHAFPWVYQTLEIGPIIGMPVPGTMTAVWWETQQDNTLVFGIPQVGARDADGNFLENQELQPDILVNNEPAALQNGEDQQIEAAVQHLLEGLKK